MRYLLVFLFGTFALFCVGCATNGFMQDMMQTNRGTLVVTAGITVTEVKKRSTFDIGEGVRGLPGGSKHRGFNGSARFDWQLPGTSLTFKDCSYYSLLTGYGDDEHIVDIQIITAQKYLTWEEIKAEMYDIEKRLLADGWKPVRYRDGTTATEYLKQQLEKPHLSKLESGFGGSTYGKGDVFITLLGKRPPIEEGENPYVSDKFTHYALVETRSKREQSNGDIGSLPE